MPILIPTKIGNSQGVRIPKAVFELSNFKIGEPIEYEKTSEGLLLKTKKKKPREGWAEQFSQANRHNDLDGWDDFENEFDKSEWTC